MNLIACKFIIAIYLASSSLASIQKNIDTNDIDENENVTCQLNGRIDSVSQTANIKSANAHHIDSIITKLHQLSLQNQCDDSKDEEIHNASIGSSINETVEIQSVKNENINPIFNVTELKEKSSMPNINTGNAATSNSQLESDQYIPINSSTFFSPLNSKHLQSVSMEQYQNVLLFLINTNSIQVCKDNGAQSHSNQFILFERLQNTTSDFNTVMIASVQIDDEFSKNLEMFFTFNSQAITTLIMQSCLIYRMPQISSLHSLKQITISNCDNICRSANLQYLPSSIINISLYKNTGIILDNKPSVESAHFNSNDRNLLASLNSNYKSPSSTPSSKPLNERQKFHSPIDAASQQNGVLRMYSKTLNNEIWEEFKQQRNLFYVKKLIFFDCTLRGFEEKIAELIAEKMFNLRIVDFTGSSIDFDKVKGLLSWVINRRGLRVIP